MKKLLLSLCLLGTMMQAQTLIEKEFATSLPMSMSDATVLPDGSFMLAGYAFPQGQDSVLAIIMKTDSLLNLKWAKRYKALAKDDFRCITPTSDGNLLVGGAMRQNFVNQSGGSIYKIDTAGNVIWHRVYSDSYDDRTIKIYEQADSSLMIFIRKGVTNQPTKVVHASSNGNMLSERIFFEGSRGLLVDNVTTDGNGTYYMAGDFFDGSLGYQRFFIAALDASSFLWYREYYLGRAMGNYALTYTTDDYLVAGGTIADTNTVNTSNLWVMRLDKQGNESWTREFTQAGAYTEFLSHLQPAANGDITAWGYALNDTGSAAIALRIDSSGGLQWTKGFNYQNGQFVQSVEPVPDGRILINASYAGQVYLLLSSEDLQVACSGTVPSLMTMPINGIISSSPPATGGTPTIDVNILAPDITPISVTSSLLCTAHVGVENLSLNYQLQLYPMPCEHSLDVKLPDGTGGACELRITDMFGREIRREVFIAPLARLDVSGLSSGIYWLELKTNSQLLRQKFIKK